MGEFFSIDPVGKSGNLLYLRNNEWDFVNGRPRRPLSSVVLDSKIKTGLLRDIKDFIASEKWYTKRGLPWRRGYLLYGTPGSGKTSISKLSLFYCSDRHCSNCIASSRACR